MRLDHFAGIAFDHLMGRILRRAALVLLIAGCALVAIYQFTAAGSLALETHYDAIHARLVIGAIYLAIAVIFAVVLWALRQRGVASSSQPNLVSQREMQLVMLVEALMLGYSLARKSNRAP